MSGMTQQSIAEFLEAVGAALHAVTQLPEFDELTERDPEAGGVGVVHATPDDIEAAVVMALQRIALEKEQEQEEKRLAAQSGAIATQQQILADGQQLPDASKLHLAQSELETAVDDDAVAREAFEALSAAWGKPDQEFADLQRRASEAIEARAASVAALHRAIEAEVARRQEAVNGLKGQDDKVTAQLAPEVAGILQTGTGKAVTNFKGAREVVAREMAVLEQAATDATAEVFDQQVKAVGEALKGVTGKIQGINDLAKQAREKNRAERIKALEPRTGGDPDAGMLQTQELQGQLTNKIQLHKKLHTELGKLPKTATNEAFDLKAGAVEAARDEADTAALALQRAVSDEKQRRRDLLDLLTADRKALPEIKVESGTPEAKELLEAGKPFNQAYADARKLAVAGKAGPFASAEKKARDQLPALKNAIEAANVKAAERALKLEALRGELNTLVSDTVGALAAGPPLQTVMDPLRQAFQASAVQIIRLIAGLDDKRDAAEAERLRKCARQARQLGSSVLSIDTTRWTLVCDNVIVNGCILEVQKCLASPGIGDTCILKMDEMCKAVITMAGQYNGAAGLQARVTLATSTPTVLPQKQSILAGYPAFVAKANLDTLGLREIPVEVKKFADACDAIAKSKQDAQEQAEYEASAMAAFITYFWANSENAVCLELVRLLDSNDDDEKAVLVPGIDGYQCKNERNGHFSVEREIMIGGRKGLLMHAHCFPDGTPKPGNGCHIKLEKERHKTGGYGVMLNNTLRGRLLPSAGTNLNAVSSMKLD